MVLGPCHSVIDRNNNSSQGDFLRVGIIIIDHKTLDIDRIYSLTEAGT